MGENSVGVLDPATGRLTRSIAVDAGPGAVVAGFGAIWTANTNADTVSRIDQTTGSVTRIVVQSAPSAITIGAGSVWVTNGASGTVSRIDPTTDRTRSIEVGTAPGGVTVAAGAVWVTNTGDATVSRIDPAQNSGRSDHPGRSWARGDHRRQRHLGGQCHVEHRVADRSGQQCRRVDDPGGS